MTGHSSFYIERFNCKDRSELVLKCYYQPSDVITDKYFKRSVLLVLEHFLLECETWKTRSSVPLLIRKDCESRAANGIMGCNCFHPVFWESSCCCTWRSPKGSSIGQHSGWVSSFPWPPNIVNRLIPLIPLWLLFSFSCSDLRMWKMCIWQYHFDVPYRLSESMWGSVWPDDEECIPRWIGCPEVPPTLTYSGPHLWGSSF